jgi:large conductance mechanosensitive channel
MLKEFKSFAFKGSMLDLAVGVIIGAAFGKVITSMVNDLMMPFLGLLLGRVNFSELYITLNGKTFDSLKAAETATAPILYYGRFISTFIDFIIVAFAIFLAVHQIARFKKKEEVKQPDSKECPKCLSEIPLKASRCKFCTAELE